MRHPAAVKYAKWVSWLSGIAASVGSAVSLPVELYRTFHTLNQSDEEIRTRIENVTAYLEELEEKSKKEFQDYPDETIYDLYHSPLKRDARGVSIRVRRFASIGRRSDRHGSYLSGHPRVSFGDRGSDTSYEDNNHDSCGLHIYDHRGHLATAATSYGPSKPFGGCVHQRHYKSVNDPGNTNGLVRNLGQNDTQDVGMDYFGDGGIHHSITLCGLCSCIRRCCAFIHTRLSSSTSSQPTNYPRALPLEPIELANVPLDNINNVNFYEVIPVAQPAVAEPPAPAVPLSQ